MCKKEMLNLPSCFTAQLGHLVLVVETVGHTVVLLGVGDTATLRAREGGHGTVPVLTQRLVFPSRAVRHEIAHQRVMHVVPRTLAFKHRHTIVKNITHVRLVVFINIPVSTR